MENANEQKQGMGADELQEALNLRVFMPQGLGLHILRSLGPQEVKEEDKVRISQFTADNANLFHELMLSGDVEAGLVIVKVRTKNVVDGKEETGFALEGGIVGSAEECMALVMHLTEQVQGASAPQLAPVPEGKTEADRCPGCGGFHEDEEGDEPASQTGLTH